MGTDNKSERFWVLIESVRERLTRSPPLLHEDLAINYELAGAIDLINEYLGGGGDRLLDQALERLRALAEGREKPLRLWVTSTLSQLRTLAESMTHGERDAAAESSAGIPAEPILSTRPSTSSCKCDLLVVAALFDPELSAFLSCLQDVRDHPGSRDEFLPGATYYTGLLAGPYHRGRSPLSVVAIFQNRPGMVDCAALVASAILFFRPRLLAMTGVCAGRLRMGVKLNDILVPASVFTCDTGKHTERKFEREPLWIDIDDRIIQRVRAAGPKILSAIVDRLNMGGAKFVTPIPNIHHQAMASGSAVVDRRRMMDEIARSTRKVAGVDMEAYGLIRAAKIADPSLPSFVVKGVMDLGSRKTDRHKDRAAFWAATFLSAFVTSEFETLRSD